VRRLDPVRGGLLDGQCPEIVVGLLHERPGLLGRAGRSGWGGGSGGGGHDEKKEQGTHGAATLEQAPGWTERESAANVTTDAGSRLPQGGERRRGVRPSAAGRSAPRLPGSRAGRAEPRPGGRRPSPRALGRRR